jgi:hypothetical protein
MQEAKRQKEAVEEIKKLGGAVSCDYEIDESDPFAADPSGPACLRNLLKTDFFAKVVSVSFWSSSVNDDELKILKRLPQLQMLSLRSTQLTDAGLENLKEQTQLQTLSLRVTRVTDAGLENLKGLTQLQELSLSGTMVTDAGLDNLKRKPPGHYSRGAVNTKSRNSNASGDH